MMKLVFLGFILVCFSCKKYVHPDLSTSPSCELCPFAESISGTYRGQVTGFNAGWGLAYTDSITIYVDHIFLNNNNYDDSTIMYFSITRDYDSLGISFDTIQIDNEFGLVGFKASHTRIHEIHDGIYSFQNVSWKAHGDYLIIHEFYADKQ